MKKLLSINYSAAAFNFAMLVLRVVLGVLIIPHGYGKLIHFAERRHHFMNFLGMGSTASLSLIIFAEFFCGILLVMGFFTRLALIPLLIGLSVALIKSHGGEIFGDGEHATLFLVGFFVLLLLGPGRISVDGAITK